MAVPKLPPFDERTDDLDAYLHRFEGYSTMQGWPKERWVSNLSALLKGNALGVFHRMSTDDCNDYDLLKVALLNRYPLTDADFRDKFRQAKPEDGESFSQIGNRVTRERTPDSFKEMCVIAEQYLKAHRKSFRHWWMPDKSKSEGREVR